MRSKRAVDDRVYQLKVTLRGIRPPIWRRIQVPADIRLDHLHDVLQAVMGWYDCHLHQFAAGGEYYGVPDPEYNTDIQDERKVRLNQLARREKAKLHYEYDFGDSWEHGLLVEKIGPREEGAQYPLCLAGRRACPPED